MYIIGNIIVGTHMLWSDEGYAAVKNAYARHLFREDREKFREIAWGDAEPDPDMTDEDLLDGILECGDDFDFEEHFEDEWTVLYHGGANRPMYVGVEIDSFDDTDHFPLESICNVRPTSIQRETAMKKWQRLPEEVRNALPPVDVYIVWSSS